MNRLFTVAGIIALAAYAIRPAWSQETPGGAQPSSGQTQQAAGTPAQQGTQGIQSTQGVEAQSQPGVQGERRGRVGAIRRNRTEYGGIGQRPWFGNPGVRQQLGINDNQFKQLNQGYGTAWSRYNQSVRGLGNDLAPEQRAERMRALRSDFNRDFSQSRDTVFNDPGRRDRYNQLYYQYQGYGAFEDPTLQQRLNMTAEQRRQLQQYRDDWNGEMNSLEESYTSDPDSVAERYRKLQLQARERLGTVLTPEQRTQWNETTGESYDFEPDSYFESNRTARRPNQLAPERTNRQ